MVIKMPIITKTGLAANEILKKEHIQILEEDDNILTDSLEIGILNLMPKKQDTEIQLLRELSNANKKVNKSSKVKCKKKQNCILTKQSVNDIIKMRTQKWKILKTKNSQHFGTISKR